MSKSLKQRILSALTSGALTASCLFGSTGGFSRIAGAADSLAYPLRPGSRDEMIESSTILDEQGGRDPAVLLAGINAEGPNGRSLLVAGDLEKTLDNYTQAYALGIASQFCVFLKDGMEVQESDAEGRIAVGGDVKVATPWGSYSFAKGDYAHQIPLSDLLNDHGYAHMIVGGNMTGGDAGGKANDGYYDTSYPFENAEHLPSSGDRRAWSFEKKDKILVLNHDEDDPIDDSCLVDEARAGEMDRGIDKTQTYVTKLFDFDEQFAMLRSRSEAINIAAQDSPLGDDAVDTSNGPAVFDAGLNGKVQDVVVFNISAEKWAEIQQKGEFQFVNIPKLLVPRKVVHADDNTCEVTYEYWNYAYIVINVSDPDGNTTAYSLPGSDVRTTINGVNISNTGGYMSNNNPGVTSILYNFSDAQSMKLSKNFQGTIFAPKASVRDGDSGRGHLSGALIAKDFVGKTEFGYRPYTGPASVLGVNMKYVVRALKTVTTGNEKIEGATFTLYRIENGNEVAVSTGVSDADGIALLNVPTEGEYVLRETRPAPGYALGDTAYHFTLAKDGEKQMVCFPQGEVQVAGDAIVMNLDQVAAREEVDKDSLTFDVLEDMGYLVIGNPAADSDVGKVLTQLGPNKDQKFGMSEDFTVPAGTKINSVTLWMTDPVTKNVKAKSPSISFMTSKNGDQYDLAGEKYRIGNPPASQHIIKITADVTVANDATGTISVTEEGSPIGAAVDQGSGTYTLFESAEPLPNYNAYNIYYKTDSEDITIDRVTFTTDLADAFEIESSQEFSKVTFEMDGTRPKNTDTSGAFFNYEFSNDDNLLRNIYKITMDVTVESGSGGQIGQGNRLSKEITESDPEFVLFDNSKEPSPDAYNYHYKVPADKIGEPGYDTDLNGWLSEPAHPVSIFSQGMSVSKVKATYTDGPDEGT